MEYTGISFEELKKLNYNQVIMIIQQLRNLKGVYAISERWNATKSKNTKSFH